MQLHKAHTGLSPGAASQQMLPYTVHRRANLARCFCVCEALLPVRRIWGFQAAASHDEDRRALDENVLEQHYAVSGRVHGAGD